MKNIIKLGLVAGRHDMPVDGYVLREVSNVTDMAAIKQAVRQSLAEILRAASDDVELHLYVTGLTSVALEVVSFCAVNGIPLTAYRYNRDTGDYIPQKLLVRRWRL